MFDIGLKGVDPNALSDIVTRLSDIVTRLDNVSKRMDWLSLAAVAIVNQIATKFKFDLPPQS